MAKRLTDTEKWKDAWWIGLGPVDRQFWIYLLDNCNHAGIWKAAWPLVEYSLGGRPELKNFQGRLVQLNEDTFFIPGFLTFQYGDTWDSEKIPARRAVRRELESKGLLKLARKLTTERVRTRYSMDTLSAECRYPANNSNSNNNSHGSNQGNSHGDSNGDGKGEG